MADYCITTINNCYISANTISCPKSLSKIIQTNLNLKIFIVTPSLILSLTYAHDWRSKLMREHQECFLVKLFRQYQVILSVGRVYQLLHFRMLQRVFGSYVADDVQHIFGSAQRHVLHVKDAG